MFGHEYRLEHICSSRVILHPLELIGPVAEGIRVNAHFAGGEVVGPKLRGKMRPVGGEDAYERAAQSEQPSAVPFRAAVRLQAAHPDYLWVNRLQFISVGEIVRRHEVLADMYALG